MAESNFQVLSDEQKMKIQQLIEDGLQFVDVKKEFLCTNCRTVPIYNYVYPCNHPYCKDCFTFFAKSKIECRKCSSTIGSEKKQSKDLEKSIYTLASICPNKLFGCSQQIELQNLLTHLDDCKFSKKHALPKLYEFNKDQSVQINEDCEGLEKSVQEFQQSNAEYMDDYQILLDQNKKYKHLLELSNEKVKKLEKSNQQMLEEKIEKLAPIIKIFQNLKEIKREEDKDCPHADSQLKNEPLQVSTYQWDNLNFSDQKEITDKIEEIKCLKNGTLLWKIENYENKKRAISNVFSEPFYTGENGYKMKIKIHFKFDMVMASIELLPGDINRLQSCFIHFRATLSILDQSGSSKKRDKVIVHEPRFGEEANVILNNDYFYWKILRKTKEEDIYVKDDTIFIMAIVEPLTSLFENFFSKDGILVFPIENYALTKEETIKKTNRLNYSEYFYSSESGYRMQASVMFNDKSILFYLWFLIGEFDAKLLSYFNHKFTVLLVNQNNNISSKDIVIGYKTLTTASAGKKVVRDKMSSYYCHEIEVSLSSVENEPYLLNDKLVVKFLVEEV